MPPRVEIAGHWDTDRDNVDSIFAPGYIPDNPRRYESFMDASDRMSTAGGLGSEEDLRQFRPMGSSDGGCPLCWTGDGIAEYVKFFPHARFNVRDAYLDKGIPEWTANTYPSSIGQTVYMHLPPVDLTNWVTPYPGSGPNFNTDTTLEACRDQCDSTMNCNHIAYVPTSSVARYPGCYMYRTSSTKSSVIINTEVPYARFTAPGEIVYGIESWFSTDAINPWQEAAIVFQSRQCDLAEGDLHFDDNGTPDALAASITDYTTNPSAPFGEAADNTGITIAFLDDKFGQPGASVDVITIAGRDPVSYTHLTLPTKA